jgi:uncharacterized protein
MPEHMTPSPRLDPNAPLVLDSRTLGTDPGSFTVVRRTVPAPATLTLELIGVPRDAPIHIDLRLDAVTEGVFVSGTVTGPLVGECVRCLDSFSDGFAVHVQELFVHPNIPVADVADDEDEVGRLVGDLIDFEPAVRDAVVLALSPNPLCRPDCGGLCATCGMKLDDLPVDHSHDTIDPRWAALGEKFATGDTAQFDR